MTQGSRWLREPLLHFGLIGAGLFALARVFAPDQPEDATVIDLSAAVQRELAATLEARSGRAPSAEEVTKSAERWLEDEVLYREGLRLGLDRDDTLIRSRIVEKMRFVLSHSVAAPMPSEAELRAFHREHAQHYQPPRRYDFEHLELIGSAPADPGAARVYRDRTAENVRAVLGPALAAQLFEQAPGSWHTLEHEQQRHMLKLTRVHNAEPASFEQLRPDLERDWKRTRQSDATRDKLEALRREYRVERGDV